MATLIYKGSFGGHTPGDGSQTASMTRSSGSKLTSTAIIDSITYSIYMSAGRYSSSANWIISLYTSDGAISYDTDYQQMYGNHQTVEGELSFNKSLASSLFQKESFTLYGEAGAEIGTTVYMGSVTITIEYHKRKDYKLPNISLEKEIIHPGEESRVIYESEDLADMQSNTRWTFVDESMDKSVLRKSSQGAAFARHVIPEEWKDLFTDKTEEKIEVKVTTRVDGELIGDSQIIYQTLMLAPTEEMKPSQKEEVSPSAVFSYQLLQKVPVDSSLANLCIQGISELKFSCAMDSFEGQYGATIKEFYIAEYNSSGEKIREYHSTSDPITISPTYEPNGTTFKGWVIDSKELSSDPIDIIDSSTNETLRIVVTPYQPPQIFTLTADQCTENGDLSADGTYIKSTYTFSLPTVLDERILETDLLYREIGGNWVSIKDTNVNSGDTVIFGSGRISSSSAYEVKLYINDGVSEASKTVKVTMASFIMFCRDDGTGVGFGTICRKPNSFVINEGWDFYLGETNVSSIIQNINNGGDSDDDNEPVVTGVTSVNGMTGDVILDAGSIGALSINGTAKDSEALGGVAADQYALKTDIRTYASGTSLDVAFALYTEFDFLSGRWSLSGKLGDTGYHSQMLPIVENTTYYMGYLNTGVQCVGGFFDADGNWLSELRTETVETHSYKLPDGNNQNTNYAELYKFTAPAGAYFFSYNISDGNAYKYRQYICTKPIFALSDTGNHIIYEGDSVYQEKKDKSLCVIGASGVMIDRLYADEINQYIVGFQEYLAPYYKNVESYGFYSGSWANYNVNDPSIYSGIVTAGVDLSGYDEFILIPSTADITITGLGEIDSTDTGNYFGGQNGVIEYIYSQVPTAKIYLANSLHKGKYYTDVETQELMDELNAKLASLSAYKSYQLVDLVSGTGINDKTYEALTYDGTHLNQEGSRIQGLCILKAIFGGSGSGGTIVEVDETLAEEGKAADAAAVGEKINETLSHIGDVEKAVDDLGSQKMDKSNPTGTGSISVGTGSVATGRTSAAFGTYAKAQNGYTFATGWQTEATAEYQVVHGSLNVIDTEDKYRFIIGNGYVDQETFIQKRSNAFTVDNDGNGWFKGNVYFGGTSQDNASMLIAIEAVTDNEVSAFMAEYDLLKE